MQVDDPPAVRLVPRSEGRDEHGVAPEVVVVASQGAGPLAGKQDHCAAVLHVPHRLVGQHTGDQHARTERLPRQVVGRAERAVLYELDGVPAGKNLAQIAVAFLDCDDRRGPVDLAVPGVVPGKQPVHHLTLVLCIAPLLDRHRRCCVVAVPCPVRERPALPPEAVQQPGADQRHVAHYIHGVAAVARVGVHQLHLEPAHRQVEVVALRPQHVVDDVASVRQQAVVPLPQVFVHFRCAGIAAGEPPRVVRRPADVGEHFLRRRPTGND